MNKNNSCILVIDAQIDFCDLPGSPLPVPGAVKDIERISKFIENVNPHSIYSSLDNHYPLDIAHIIWFRDAKGNYPDPFTIIEPEDVECGRFTPVKDPKRTLQYLYDLRTNGEFKHMLWPLHCITGTPGQTLHPTYQKALNEWMIKNSRWVNFIRKGTNPLTEHFGIFRANVPLPEDSTTNVDQATFKTIEDHDTVYIAGEARTHCVANSLRQMLQIAPSLAPKIVVLEDCMSDVKDLPQDFYDMVDGIYADARSKGVQFARSTDI